jgi:threonine dehydrogenase-like Zn-dependent dehydrogenase
VKAVVLRGVHDLRLEVLPDPRPAPDEVLVRIRAAGLCGTDVHMWEGTKWNPRLIAGPWLASSAPMQ